MSVRLHVRAEVWVGCFILFFCYHLLFVCRILHFDHLVFLPLPYGAYGTYGLPAAHGMQPTTPITNSPSGLCSVLCGLWPVACGLWPAACHPRVCGLRACGLRPVGCGMRREA